MTKNRLEVGRSWSRINGQNTIDFKTIRETGEQPEIHIVDVYPIRHPTNCMLNHRLKKLFEIHHHIQKFNGYTITQNTFEYF